MTYTEEQRDLFSVPEDYYLVQCISADLAMGKGIAIEFNKRFDMKRKLKKRFPSGFLTPDGDYETIGSILEGKVFNLVTKAIGWNKSTYYTLEGALYFLKEECEDRGIKKLAMPLIGCGMDGLNWIEVSYMIKEMFKDIDIEILVCRQ